MKSGGLYKWELLAWLWLAFFFNQADRQIFNVVMPLIRSDLGLTDAQLGLVSSLFVLTIGLFIPIAGFAGDSFDRKKVICISLLFWSVATLCTGVSVSVVHLVLFRSIAVGGGEAFYAPAANALIGDYHRKTRAIAMSVHQTSVYAGVILSGVLGGYLAELYGWKSVFYLFGGIGVMLSAALLVRLKPAPPSQQAGIFRGAFMKKALAALYRQPTALLLGGAFTCLVFVNVGYLTWMPTFLHEKFHLSITGAGFSSMFYHHAAAFAGVLVGGWWSDRLAVKGEKRRLTIQGGGLLLGAPFIWLMGQSTGQAETYLWLAAFGFCRGIYEANIYTTLFAVIQPAYRATSVGFISMFAFIGSAVAPFILGYLKPTLGLSHGLSALSVAYVLGAVLVFLALGFFFERDSARILVLEHEEGRAEKTNLVSGIK